MPCTIERQITVALEDRPEQLTVICQTLAEKGINICALSVIDNVAHGVVRLITNDPPGCRAALAGAGFYLVEADVLALDLLHRPGELARACGILAAARVNVEYIYSSGVTTDRGAGGCQFIFKVSDLPGARRALEAAAASATAT